MPLIGYPSLLLSIGICLVGLAAPLSRANAKDADAPTNARARADKICLEYRAGYVAGRKPGECIKLEERRRQARIVQPGVSPAGSPTTVAPSRAGAGAPPAESNLNNGITTGQAPGQNGGFGAGQAHERPGALVPARAPGLQR